MGKEKEGRFIRFSYFGHSINEVYWFILPLLLPKILREFGLSYLKAGGLLTVYLIVVSIFSFIIGKASDSFPRWKILISGFFIAFAGFIMAGLSSSLPILTFCIALGAVGVSAFHPVAYALLDESTSLQKGRLFGNFESWGMAGVVGMLALNGILLSFFTWRTVLVISAFPSLLMGILALTTTAPSSSFSPNYREKTSFGSVRLLLRLVLFFMTVVFRIMSILGVLNFIPTYLMDELGTEEHLAAFSTGIYFIGALIGSRLGGKGGDTHGHLKILMGATLLMSPLIALLGMIQVWWYAPLLLLFLGISAAASAPNQNYILSKLSGGMGRGATFGTLVGILTMTNALSPLIFGAGADVFGLAQTIRLFATPMVLSFLILTGLSLTPGFKQSLTTKE